MLYIIIVISLFIGLTAHARDDYRKIKGPIRQEYVRKAFRHAIPNLKKIKGCGSLLKSRFFFQVDKKGNISHWRWIEDTGSSRCNELITEALLRSAPYPKPPAIIANSNADEGLVFTFGSRKR